MKGFCAYLLVLLMVAMGGITRAQTMSAKDYFLLGSAKYKCRACEEAIKEFTKALNLNKNYAEAYYGRGLAYSCIKDFTNATMDIDRAIRLKPEEVLYVEGKARIKLEAGRNQEAMAGFKNALRMDSLCWQAWYGMGQVGGRVDSTRSAQAAYSKTIELNPDFAMGYIGRAETLMKMGEDGLAIKDLNVAEKLANQYYKVFSLRSEANFHLTRYDDAIIDANKAVELAPEDGHVYYVRAESFFATEQYARASADYTKALSLNKSDAMAWYKKGLCGDRMGVPKVAKKSYSKAVKKNKSLLDAWSARASVWEKLEKPKKAVPDLGKAIALAPADASLRLRRGFLLLQLERVQLASDDFVQATRLQPENGLGFYGLGMARYQNGNVRGACDAWKQAAALGETKASEQLAKYCNE